jgi:hypothetical protein
MYGFRARDFLHNLHFSLQWLQTGYYLAIAYCGADQQIQQSSSQQSKKTKNGLRAVRALRKWPRKEARKAEGVAQGCFCFEQEPTRGDVYTSPALGCRLAARNSESISHLLPPPLLASLVAWRGTSRLLHLSLPPTALRTSCTRNLDRSR